MEQVKEEEKEEEKKEVQRKEEKQKKEEDEEEKKKETKIKVVKTTSTGLDLENFKQSKSSVLEISDHILGK
ncbi:hypothetical protein G6F68_020872 [Rhizopus microsporus]|nr:hypothetical protein G6F68_020872 [Rhizopus microsporus]